jgi:hypothetical protein
MGVLDAPSYTSPQANARFARARLAVVATKGASYNQGISNGTLTSGTARVKHKAVAAVAGVRLVYGNMYGQNGTQQNGPNAIAVKASVEDASGNLWPVSFDGRRTVTIDPGQIIMSDPVPIILAAAATFYSRTYVSVSSGEKWPLGMTTLTADSEGNNYGTPGTDSTDSGSVSSAFAFCYSPLAILGNPNISLPTVLQVGDSIIDGQGDSPVHDKGFFSKD